MADLLTDHAATQGDKLAVIDDRTGGDIRRLTYAELEDRSNRLADVLASTGVERGDKVVWCGQNSTGVVEMVNAARKLGVTAVPLNYRLSDDEAAYVVDHSDASTVFVDAEFAPLFERIVAEIPKVARILVFDGSAPDGMIASDPLPDYEAQEDPGDIIRFTRRRLVDDEGGLAPLTPATLEAARAAAPGWDIYALEAEWRGFWVASGRQKISKPDAAFLGWLRGRIQRG